MQWTKFAPGTEQETTRGTLSVGTKPPSSIGSLSTVAPLLGELYDAWADDTPKKVQLLPGLLPQTAMRKGWRLNNRNPFATIMMNSSDKMIVTIRDLAEPHDNQAPNAPNMFHFRCFLSSATNLQGTLKQLFINMVPAKVTVFAISAKRHFPKKRSPSNYCGWMKFCASWQALRRDLPEKMLANLHAHSCTRQLSRAHLHEKTCTSTLHEKTCSSTLA